VAAQLAASQEGLSSMSDYAKEQNGGCTESGGKEGEWQAPNFELL
jgi:hypothetical protein